MPSFRCVVETRSWSPLVVLLVSLGILFASGCSDEATATPVVGEACDVEGAVEDNLICKDGYWSVQDLDAGVDADVILDAEGPDDVDPEDVDAECQPETDAEFCERLGAECGEIVENDNCGDARMVDCDDFEDFGCGELGYCVLAEDNDNLDVNICSCPPVDFEGDDQTVCDELDADCGTVDPGQLCVEWEDVDEIDCGGCSDGECGLAGPNICGCPCEIDGECLADGVTADDDACMVCNPEESDTQFTEADDGASCGDNAVCQDGDCVCDENYLDCEGECIDPAVDDDYAECDGVCVNVATNEDHCGECDESCGEIEICSDGQCVEDCPSGEVVCDDACVDTETDPDHCGGCGSPCSDLEFCSGGQCVEDCPSGEVVCGDSCANTDTDDEHCGDCGEDCTEDDGWYDDGTSYDCCEDGQACSCQDEEYREYYCDQGSCSYEVTDSRTETSGCSSCDDGDACTDSYCSDGTCYDTDYCSGSDSECGCSTCTNCTASDGWYDDGASSYDCCDGGAACTCNDEEYREYYCDGTDCDYNVTDQRTVTSGCSSCDDGSSCTESFCSGGSCQHDDICSGSDTNCGCSSCTDCTTSDGWYDDGASSYDCCDGGAACTCNDEEYREYYCDGTDCDYNVTDQRTVTSGCSSCDDGNDCTDNFCANGTCMGETEDDGTSCGTSASEQCCNGQCVDTDNDVANCGGCHAFCGEYCEDDNCDLNSEYCSGGVCHCELNDNIQVCSGDAECAENSQCPGECNLCTGGNCEESDSACGDDEICQDGSCECYDSRTDSQVCDDQNAECGSVTDDCGEAVYCGLCDSGSCNTSTNQCEDGECDYDWECDAGEVCCEATGNTCEPEFSCPIM